MRNDSQPALLLQRAMLRANKLAIRGLGLTTPNPIVGAVILDAEGKEVASGFHRGGDHAEVIAINGALAQGFSDFSSVEEAVLGLNLGSHDVFVTMGAGEAYKIADKVFQVI